MPRQSPLKPRDIPPGRKQPLSQKPDFAGLLGFPKLADEVIANLVDLIALAKATQSTVAGLTRQSRVAEFRRWEKKLRREQQTGRLNTRLRQLIANPALGLDTETFLQLAPLVNAPSSLLLAAVEARRCEIERLPRISPQREARDSAGGTAVWFFLIHSADHVRDEPGAWWEFALAFLDAAGFGTVKLRQHPEDLRPLLDTLRLQASGLAATVRAGLRRAPSLTAKAPDSAGG